jgi:two-component system, NtrC family, nitrogen regulation sensor histidine kinase NtrY
MGAVAMGRMEARLRLARAMNFRTKLLVAFAATVIVAVGLDSFIVEKTTRDAFERLDTQRSATLEAQFLREFERRQAQVVQRTERMAASDVLRRIAVEADYAPYVDEARTLAGAQALDFVELTTPDGAIISSAQWPARFGYKDEWVARMGSSGIMTAVLKREELPEEIVLALVAVRTVTVGDNTIYIAAGEKLDEKFVASLDLPQGMRVFLSRDPQPAAAASPLIDAVRREQKEQTRVAGAETLHAIPLLGRDKELLAVLVIGSSRADMLAVESFIRRLGFSVGAAGVLLGLALAWWATARITRPVHELADAARQVATGNWSAHVDISSRDEIGELARAFNQMTQELTEQRERLVQSERVAAWRELARRLAHELKNPLFPLLITVENMRRAREQYPEQFDEVFREGSATLLAELANLKTIINRFSDFSKMPPPQRQSTNVNEIVGSVMKLFEAQLAAQNVTAAIELDDCLPATDADPAQLHRALQNLVLNALDAMPLGGTLTVRTAHTSGSLRLEVSDTGSGLTTEECERLFTPYYTTKQHGTGLGLAIVQSVVSDHGGTISVSSEPGRGATFRIELQNGASANH